MNQSIVLIEHHSEPHDDRASVHLMRKGFSLDWRAPHIGDDLDMSLENVAGSIIFGGAQSVSDQNIYPFLIREIEWINKCIANDIPLLGLCLGGQLIAHALGATIRPHDAGIHEFGYYPISPTADSNNFLSRPLYVMQAHYEGFDLPNEARLLASGANYPNQAFMFGQSTYGFQFHPECTLSTLRRWQASDWAPWNYPGSQTKEQQDNLSASHNDSVHTWFINFLDSLFLPRQASTYPLD